MHAQPTPLTFVDDLPLTASASKRALTPELALYIETRNPIRNAMLT